MRIHYAQCWEDPQTLRQALDITPGDNIISIASGGDNTFSLLLNNPGSLTAVDRNPIQIFLVELKMRAIERLEYDEFVRFVGARSDENRERIYSRIRPHLSRKARAYWDENPDIIQKGIIHCGKFEHYFRIFRKYVIPLIHTRKTVNKLLEASSLEEQERFYEQTWNNRRWQVLFRIFFGKFLLGRLGRDPSLFQYVTLENIADEILNWTRHGLTEVPINTNYFIEYILRGKYNNLEVAPPYLQPTNFLILKEQIKRVHLVCESLEEYLKTLQPKTISKFNLSDIFEYMPDEEVESALHEILRVSSSDARLALWTLFIPRSVPPALKGQIRPCSDVSESLHFSARTFFYGSFQVWAVK